MKFSLITQDGYWIQNHIGDIDSAIKLADDTNKVNSNKLNIYVIDEVPSSVPILNIYKIEKVYYSTNN